MSTHATEALVQSSQGGVAHGAEVYGKRVHKAELGNNDSAGFAQILGEHVTKSTAQAEAGEKAGHPFTPQDVPSSSPHAPTQALPQSPPHTSPEPTPHTSEQTAPRVRAQAHVERSQHASATPAPALPEQPRQDASTDHDETAPSENRGVLPRQNGEAARNLGQTTRSKAQPIAQSIAQPAAIDSRPRFSTARPESSATNTQPSKPTPTTNHLSARVGEAVYKFAGQPENPARQTLAPTCEAQSTHPTQAQPTQNNNTTANVHAPVSTPKATDSPLPTPATNAPIADSIATPTKATETAGAAQISARHGGPASPPPVVLTEAPPSPHVSSREGQDPAHEFSAARLPVNPDHAPSPGPTSTAIRGQIVTQSPAANRLSTKTNEAVATLPAKPGEDPVRAPVRTIDTAVHAQPATSDNSHRMTAKADEAAAPAAPRSGQSTVYATVQTRPSVAPSQSTANKDTRRSPAPSPSLHVDQTAAPPKHSATPTSANNGIGISTPPVSRKPGSVSESIANPVPARTPGKIVAAAPAPRQAHPVAPLLAAKPTDISKDGASVVVAPQAQELPHPNPAAAPRSTAAAIQQHAPSRLAPEPREHAQKEDASVQSHTRNGSHSVVEAAPSQERRPAKSAASSEAPAVAQGPSLANPQPNPAKVAQEFPTTPLAHNPEPASQPEKASPIPAAKASTRAAIARPATRHPDVQEETKSTESAPEVKAAEPNANHVVASSESSARAIADKPVPASPKHAKDMRAPEPGHVGNKSTVHVEPVAGKRRARVEDEKELKEPSADPAKTAPTNLQSSQTSTNEGMEVKAPKQETPKITDERISTGTSSQTSNAQPPASQPHTVKEAPPPVVLPAAEHATVFVSPNSFLPARSEAGGHEAPAPSSAAAETAGLVDRAVADPGLSVSVMPHSAHLSIAGDAGDLSLHVRVRDGSADVNVSGSMAPLFDTKAPEMRTALAGEGLQLGSFATDQRGGFQGQQGQPESTPRTNDSYPPPAPRRTTTSTPEVQIAADRRIHVTA